MEKRREKWQSLGWNLQWQLSSMCGDMSETQWKGRTGKRIQWNTKGDHLKKTSEQF